MSKTICKNCGGEFEPRVRLKIFPARFGSPRREKEQDEDMCPDCIYDLGLPEFDVDNDDGEDRDDL